MINWRIRRARNLKGRYKADDQSTVFNEAWVGGKSPNKNWFKKQWQKLTNWWWTDFYGR